MGKRERRHFDFALPLQDWRKTSHRRPVVFGVFILCLLSLAGAGAPAQTANIAALPKTIDIVTEEHPPSNFVDPTTGTVTGQGTDIVRAVLAELGIEGRIRVLPWARAVHDTQMGKNVLIYSIVRNREREDQYKWVGTISPYGNRFYAYVMAESPIVITDLGQLRNYRLGSTIRDFREDYLVHLGLANNLESVPNDDINYQKLKHGRIDLWPVTEGIMLYTVRKAGDDPKRLKAVWHFNLDGRFGQYAGANYMAFGKDTPDELVAAFRAALQKIKDDGRFDALNTKWVAP